MLLVSSITEFVGAGLVGEVSAVSSHELASRASLSDDLSSTAHILIQVGLAHAHMQYNRGTTAAKRKSEMMSSSRDGTAQTYTSSVP